MPRDLAATAAELLGSEPAVALPAALALEAEARAAGDGRAAAIAAQAAGIALRDGGDLPRGREALRRAVVLAEAAGDADQGVRARVSLVGLHLLEGDLEAAEREGEAARARAGGADAGRLDVQLAVVAERAGRLRDALARFDAAERVLTRAGDDLWLARLRFNRAVALAQLGRLAEAERDTERSARLLEAAGPSAAVAHNRAWLAALAGDVPRALARYDDALAAARAACVPGGLVLRDRAELLGAVGLWPEACEIAAAAVAELDRCSPVDASEARLVLATALVGARDAAAASEAAGQAASAFAAQHRPAWAARASLLRLSAGLQSGPGEADAARALGAVAVLEDAGLRSEAAEGRALAARLALAAGVDVPPEALPLVPVPGPPWVRAYAWLAEAQRRLAAGDGPGARRAVLAGLRPLDALRAVLGCVELRAGVAATAAELADLGVRLAAAGAGGRRLLDWAERRSHSATSWPVPRPAPDLIEALVVLRAAAQRLGAVDNRAQEVAATRAVVAAEAEVTRLARHAIAGAVEADRAASAGAPSVASALVASAGTWAIVRLVDIGGRLEALVVAGGRVSRHELAPSSVVAADTERLRFAVTRLAAGGRGAARAEGVLRRCAESLDTLLFGELRRRMGERPVVVVPEGALRGLPWRALPTLREVPFCVAPSAAAWLAAARRLPGVGTGAGVFVAGPGLDAAEHEVRTAAAAWVPGVARVLVGEQATSAAVRSVLEGAAHAHFACHGRFREDKPMFSSLELADGPLTVFELDHLRRPPEVVILASCDTGREHSVSGAEVMGVTAGFLGAGARTVVASAVPLADAAVGDLTVALTARLGAGQPPAEAVAAAMAPAAADADPMTRAAAFSLCCFGAG